MFRKTIGFLGLFVLSVSASADPVIISGEVESGSGALGGLITPGSSFTGDLEWTGTLDAGLVNLPSFCFSSDATGAVGSITSAACAASNPTASVVPVLPTGETTYPNASVLTTYQQAGTTFNGTSGDLNILSYSPTFNQAIPIVLTFVGDGTGTFSASNALLGTLEGSFTVDNFNFPPVSGGGGDPNAIPVMPIYGLILTGVGLVLVTHRRLRKVVKQK